MTDDNNQEDKPSFFDSADEAKSWPPSNGYEVEESDSSDQDFIASTEENYEPDALDELLSDGKTSKTEEENLGINDESRNDINADMLMHDFSAQDSKVKSDESSEEDFLVPKNDAEELSDSDTLESFELEKSEEQSKAEDTEKVKIVGEDEDDTLSEIFDNKNDDDKDDDDETINISARKETIKQFEPSHEIEVQHNDDEEEFDLNKYVEEKIGVNNVNSKDSTVDDYVLVPPPITDSEESSSIIEEDLEEVKPFRTYASHDYSEETVLTEQAPEQEANILAGVNRNFIILGAIIVLVLVYFLFSNLFSRKYDTRGRRKTRPPAKEKRITIEEKELVPLWEVSAQKSHSSAADRQLVQTIYKSSGRANPFAMPDSILADLQKQAQLELLKKQKPDTFRRLAYRATLVGVLTSKDNTIALVNQQEATFDVLEGTSRDKVLKLATKSMDKAKRDTQEMVVGSYIGPWVITKIVSPESAFTDAKVYIEYEGDQKILNMGKAEELGIFTEDGVLDNLEQPIGTLEEELDDFEF